MNIFTWHFGLNSNPVHTFDFHFSLLHKKVAFLRATSLVLKKKKLTIIFLASNFCEIFWSTKSAVGGFESKQQLRLFFFYHRNFCPQSQQLFKQLEDFHCCTNLFESNDNGMTLRNQSTIFFPEFSTRTFYTTKVELWSNWKLSIGTEHYIFKKTSNTWFQDGWGAGGGDIQED